MKSIKKALLFLFFVITCTSYANENKYIFVGQNECEGSLTPCFILDPMTNFSEDQIMITDNGEIYLKVDQIIAIPREHFLIENHSQLTRTANSSFFNHFNTQNISMNISNIEEYDSPAIRCSNCRRYYDPKPYQGRRCPVCQTVN